MSDLRVSNPFEELYVSETIPAREYVNLFSSFLVEHAVPLFQPGNVVLMGAQGSGKSMLLSLLKPGVRLAYDEAKITFPVPTEHQSFISAGINLRRSGASSFGQRMISEPDGSQLEQFPFYFADFVNYWVVIDLLASIATVSRSLDLASQLGVSTAERKLDEFARALASDSAWFGALDAVDSFKTLERTLKKRIEDYLNFFNYNTQDIPASVRASKSSIGAPIAAAARELRTQGVLSDACKVYVQIDQYEETRYIERFRPEIGDGFRRVVNRALGMRDEHVSYRIGARGWAWRDNLEMLGTSAKLERDREYREVNLDDLLRRKENRATWIFPKFAEDVMKRRLGSSRFDSSGSDLLFQVYGSRLSAADRALRYAKPTSAGSRTSTESFPEVPPALREQVMALRGSKPLEGMLALAWLRQQRNKRRHLRTQTIHVKEHLPWEREYWRKERVEQALFQLAADSGQRPIWSGKEDILALSGGNILVFVSISREVWAAYLRGRVLAASDATSEERVLPFISHGTQSVGIESASKLWVEKIVEQPEGDTRRRFVEILARVFRKTLLDDRAMSNPGNNGFSLTVAELDANPEVAKFIRTAADYGELFESPHTTKERNRLPRTKWYLRPIFSPYFRIPVSHTKEPIYATVELVAGWIGAAADGRDLEAVAQTPMIDDQLTFLSGPRSE